ncbi:MAG: dockerin type I repeat-containing protein [bacterium]
MNKIILKYIIAIVIFLPSLVMANTVTTFNLDIVDSPQCFDGIDNDGDLKIDFPDDPGCSSPGDNSELDIIVPPPTPPAPTGGGSAGGGGGYSTNPITTLTLSGFAYPFAKITILKDAQAMASVDTTADGTFKFSTEKLSPGSYNFSIFATDVFGIKTSLYNVPVTISYGSLAQVSNIFIAPTLSFEKNNITPDVSAVLRGQSRPNSQVVINFSGSSEELFTVIAGKDGKFLYTVGQNKLLVGSYQAKAKSNMQGEISGYGNIVDLQVEKVNTPIINCILQKKGDVNCDGKINIVDFSILAYWYGRSNAPTKYDLNGDGKISLIEFSIMAYYWTI